MLSFDPISHIERECSHAQRSVTGSVDGTWLWDPGLDLDPFLNKAADLHKRYHLARILLPFNCAHSVHFEKQYLSHSFREQGVMTLHIKTLQSIQILYVIPCQSSPAITVLALANAMIPGARSHPGHLLVIENRAQPIEFSESHMRKR